jgi:5-methylthioadenosine/S-adenosylhomocysteine deaminase
MFEEMRLAALLAKGFTGDPTAVPARQALDMATHLGARALHIDHLTGSLEPGKRADISIVDVGDIHTTPRFHRDPDSVYSLLVYAAKAYDVRHVLCDGRWLMRDGDLLTVDVEALKAEAETLARRIDRFLITREQSVLSKLLAIGGVARERTFEVQVKVHVADDAGVEALLGEDSQRAAGEQAIPVVRASQRWQYDTYFLFGDVDDARLRYREDEIVNEDGKPVELRYRLTLTGPTKEREFARSVLLSRSRFDAPANHSLRFYREYFSPSEEWEIQKFRRRYHIRYGGTDFAVNLDRVERPALDGFYLEIKSRTWSAQDAERKAQLIGELLDLFGVDDAEVLKREYLELAMGA